MSLAVDETVDRPVVWQDQANCRTVATSVMFPAYDDLAGIRRAEAVCSGCPVIQECGEAGIGERDGVWGGSIHKPRVRGRKRTRYRLDQETGKYEPVVPTSVRVSGEPVRVVPTLSR